MKLIAITDRNRRDFTGRYQCEGCEAVETINGYDDNNFHINVMPNRKCKSCGKSTLEIGAVIEKVKPKYGEGEIV